MSNLPASILAALKLKSNQTAKELAHQCKVDKTSLNRCLYFDLKDKVQINTDYQWTLIDRKKSSVVTKPVKGNNKECDDTMENQSVKTSNDNFAFDSLQSIRNRLLDLTGRNRLLNFKHGRTGFIRVIDEMPDQLANAFIRQCVNIDVVLTGRSDGHGGWPAGRSWNPEFTLNAGSSPLWI